MKRKHCNVFPKDVDGSTTPLFRHRKSVHKIYNLQSSYMHNHTITAEYIHSRKDNYMIKLEVELESIGCIVNHHSQLKRVKGTYSSAHSFSFRICSSSSDEKLFVNYFTMES